MLPRVQLHVLILLVFSVVAVVALQRMRMPSSLGYLLVGALVGPHAFGLVPDVEHNRVLAEYALRGVEKPIGVSSFELTRALPATLESSLPSIEQIEQELGGIAE